MQVLRGREGSTADETEYKSGVDPELEAAAEAEAGVDAEAEARSVTKRSDTNLLCA